MRQAWTLSALLLGTTLLFPLPPSSAEAASSPNWQADWEKTVESAKKEGQVAVYIKVGYDGVFPAFQKKYPAIKVVSVAGQAADITNRLVAERRAEKYLADVFSFGVRSALTLHQAKALDPLRPFLLLPEVVDESKWYEGHVYTDADNTYIFRYLTVAEQQLGYNNKLIKDQKEFRSYWDFLNPKWKGKIVARDVRTPGPGNGNLLFWYHNPQLGPQFLKRIFGEMDVTLTRYSRQAADWLAQGKFAICFFCSEDVELAKRQGLPVDSLDVDWKEGAAMVSQSGNLAFLKNAPHPSAAKVFINWLLSREGQIELQRALAKVQPAESRRIDIPKDDVPSDIRRRDGEKYMDLDSRPEWSDIEPVRKLLNEVLREAKK
ncbi:MAG TPA: extracellular solute-binding protein [Candidatus Binatia bacterium]